MDRETENILRERGVDMELDHDAKLKIVKDLLDLILIAADAKTNEEKARAAWRASDYMWWNVDKYGVQLCRYFNNLCDEQRWPKVKLWNEGEREQMMKEKFGGSSLQTPENGSGTTVEK